MNIKQCLEASGGVSVAGVGALVNSVVVKSGKNGQFLDGVLKDSTGEINFKVWEASTLQQIMCAGSVVRLTVATISEYQGKNQIVVTAAVTIPQEEVEALGIIPSSPYPPKDLDAWYSGILDAIATEPGYDGIHTAVDEIPKHIMGKFKMMPAARGNHHVYLRGLYEHSIMVARSAHKVALLYKARPTGYPINMGALLTGALFHDIGKTIEYEIAPHGMLSGFGMEGLLEGHGIIGRDIIKTAFSSFIPETELIKVLHIILSHHGKPEYRAAVEPAFFEAQIVSQADLLDANYFGYTTASDDAQFWSKSLGRPVANQSSTSSIFK